jgi:hypothetical protein
MQTPDNSMTKRAADLFWPLGVGMLTGWVCLYLFLVYVLNHGGRIQGWHAGIWVMATFLGTWIAVRGQGVVDGGQMSEGGGRKTEGEGQRTKDGGQSTESKHPPSGIRHLASDLWHQIRISGALTCLAIILPLVFSWVLGHFTDFSWDGMTSRGITVRSLMIGEPPPNAYPFGHVLAGFLAHITGNWQAGKGINLVMIWISFCFVFSSLEILKFKGFSVWFLSIITALSPVAVYQISSFQIDGHIASLTTCLIFLMLRFFMSETVKAESILFVLVTGIALSTAKTSGIFYGIIILGVFALFQVVFNRSRKRFLFILLGGAIFIVVGLSLRKAAFHESLDLNRLRSMTSIETPGFGVGGGASSIPELTKMNRLEQFFLSAASFTEIMPTVPNLKPVFWMQRRELRVFEELTPDPRAGGFGPLYSTALLLGGIGCCILIFKRHFAYFPGWFVFVAASASSFGSQVWWARWTPQNWLIVIVFLMTTLALPADGKTFKGVRSLAMLAAGLNVLLITLYYFVGMVKQEKILNMQIQLAADLGNPVPIYIDVIKDGHKEGASFLASEWWFVDRGVLVTKLKAKPILPRMRIHKTATYIPLPSDWRTRPRDPKDEELFRKRGLIED